MTTHPYHVIAPYPVSVPIAYCADFETALQALRDYGPARFGLDGTVYNDRYIDGETDGLTDDEREQLEGLQR